jgi:hypothetical protein
MEKAIKGHVFQVLQLLSGLEAEAALLALAESMRQVVDQSDMSAFASVKAPAIPRFLKRPQNLFKIERDREVFNYIHGQDELMSGLELHRRIVAKFGVQRSPSKSSLYRYLAMLKNNKLPPRGILPWD